jgi:hypothetical protein
MGTKAATVARPAAHASCEACPRSAAAADAAAAVVAAFCCCSCRSARKSSLAYSSSYLLAQCVRPAANGNVRERLGGCRPPSGGRYPPRWALGEGTARRHVRLPNAGGNDRRDLGVTAINLQSAALRGHCGWLASSLRHRGPCHKKSQLLIMLCTVQASMRRHFLIQLREAKAAAAA